MVKSKVNGSLNLQNMSLTDLRDLFAGEVLTGFIEEGREGLRWKLWDLMLLTLDWQKLHP